MRVTKRRKVVVVGGGITGLSAAFYIQKAVQEQQLPIDITIIESSLRVGGKIQTYRKDGLIVERGPESFFDISRSVRTLARDLNIEHLLKENKDGRSYMAVGSELHPIPSNILFGGSPEVSSFIASSAVSLSGKIRAAGDLVLPRQKQEVDESIGDFFRRRFGREVVENFIEPLLASTFAGDVDHQSLQSMFPQFYQLEKKYRSLLLGMKLTGSGFYSYENGEEQLKYETFENGLETLVETIEHQLSSVKILKGVKVDCIERMDNHALKVSTNSTEPLLADYVLVTTPFNVAKSIFRHSSAMEHVEKMDSATIGTVSMLFKEGQLEKYKDAMNFFVSRNSDFAITSCTWSNRKWDAVCPEGYELLRIYIGRVGDESIVELSDGEIERTIIQDLQRIIGLKDAPEKTIVTRWKGAMPQYTVGHEKRLEKISDEFYEQFPNVLLAGSSYEGISIPSCVAQGRTAANDLLANLIDELRTTSVII